MYFDRELWRFTRGARGRIAATVAVGLAGALVGIARLALLGWMLGLAIRGAGLDRLAWPAALAALAILARGLLERMRATMAHRTASAVQLALREALHDRVMALGPAHFAGARTGAVVVTLVDGVTQLETYFGRYLPQLVVAALTTILVFGVTAAIDLPVGLILFAGAVIALAGPGALHRRESGASLALSDAKKRYAADFLDSIQGLATLKAFGQAKAQGERLAEGARELSRRTMAVLVASTSTRGITDFAIAGGTAGALALGALRVRSGALPLEALPVLLMVGVELFRPMRELRELLHHGMLGQAAAQGVREVLAAAPAVAERAAAATTPAAAVAPTIAFEDVHFAYPGGRVAHRGLDFAVAAGERVAIVGASGAGKTTVLRLLTRLHDVARGAIRVGGVDVRDLPLAGLRAQFAIVSQDTYLFNGTIAENLRLGRPDATPDALAAAARAANALGFIEALPQGWDTPIGERGVRLSGGQRQRLAIARALLRDAPILVLDEALSAVDAENEAAIQAALDRLMAGRTTLIVAHRLSSVIGADRILVLDQGRVVEQGTHRALLAAGGRYARLMAAQLRDAATSAADDRLEPTTAGDADRAPSGGSAPVAPTPPLAWRGVLGALFGHIRPLAATMAAVCALGLARFAAFVGVGIVGALVVAAVARGGDPTPLLAPLLMLAPVAGLLHWAESYLAHDMAYRLLADMRIALYRKLEALAPGYLLRRHSGDLVATATHDVEAVEYFFAHTAAPALVAVAVPLAVLATLAAADWRLALALLPFLAFAAFGPFRARARIDRLGDAAGDAAARMNASAVDAVQGLAEIVFFQREREFRGRFLVHAEAFHAARAPLARDLADESARLEIATGLGGLAVLLAGVALAPSGAISISLLPLLVIVAMAGFAPVAEIAQTARQLAQTFASTQRLDAVHREPVTILDGPGAVPTSGPGFDLASVRFAYPGTRAPALDGIDLAVPAGRTLALVGPSGAGKTTLAMLLLRFFDPQSGRVDFRGADLRDWKLDALRAELAMVAQDTHLFNATLRRNLLLARPDADAGKLDAAIRRSALAEFVAGLPDGLDTELGERGVQLSGGQRQRVAIARAFLKDAPVLILDEATSHLDAISEAEVRAALGELMRDRTVVVIAHRLSTVRDADAIAVLGAGRVLEVGRHADLLARGGAYARLVARQAAAVAD